MHDIAINWLALIVAALSRMILGAVWYSPAVLLKPWLAAAGITEAQMKARFPKALVADIVGSLLMAFTLAHLIKFAGAESIGYGGASDFSPGWASSRSPPYPRRSTSTGRPSYG